MRAQWWGKAAAAVAPPSHTLNIRPDLKLLTTSSFKGICMTCAAGPQAPSFLFATARSAAAAVVVAVFVRAERLQPNWEA
jgi:hypothetical protein